jgi:hypothetical protein
MLIHIDDGNIPIDISLGGLVRGSCTVFESVIEEDLTRVAVLGAAVAIS